MFVLKRTARQKVVKLLRVHLLQTVIILEPVLQIVITHRVEEIVRSLTALLAPITQAARKIKSARTGIARQEDA
jgi:hypothetical protein